MRASVLAAIVPLALAASASAQELLTNPGIEIATSPSGWSLEEFATNPAITQNVNSAQSVGFANQEEGGASGMWLRSFVGAFIGNEAEATNAILSQTVPGTPGENYNFSGYSLFEQNYSGGVATLDPLSPLGAVPSPTQTLFEIAFLDAGGSVIGTPEVVDVASEQFNGFGWAQHSVNGVAPAGTASVRVSASALDMVPNINPAQSAFIDTFSLTTSSAPGTQLLENENLELASDTPDGWVIEEGQGGVSRYEGFASRTGANGFWIAPRSAGVADGPQDALFTQTVAATPGADYTLSGWSFFEPDYAGGVATLNAGSEWGAIPSDTDTFFIIEFLDGEGVVVDSAELDLRTVRGNTADWIEHEVSATAPAGAVDVKVGVRATSLRSNRDGNGPFDDAYFDDFSLMIDAGLAGDYNADGVVDAADYTVWRDGGSPDSSQAGYQLWADNYGAAAASSAAAVPEPASAFAVAVGLASLATRRRVA